MDEFYKSIKNFNDAYNYLLGDSFKDDEKIKDLLSSYNHLHPGSYEEKVFKIRVIVTALNRIDNNGEDSDFSERTYYPDIIFRHSVLQVFQMDLVTEGYSAIYSFGYVTNKQTRLESIVYIVGRSLSGLIRSGKGIRQGDILMSFRSNNILVHFIENFGNLMFDVMYSGYNYDKDIFKFLHYDNKFIYINKNV